MTPHQIAISTSTVDLPPPGEMTTEMVATCIHEPRGDFGLEGYQRGETYRCQFVKADYPRTSYYRVFPGEPADYYECAVPRTFAKFFTVEETV